MSHENSDTEKDLKNDIHSSKENITIRKKEHKLRVSLEILEDKNSVEKLENELLLDNPELSLAGLLENIQNFPNNPDIPIKVDEDIEDWQVHEEMAMPIRDITKLIPEFNGEEKNLDIFVKKVNRLWTHIDLYPQNEKNQFLLVLQLKLTDKAAEAVQNNAFENWDNVRESLIENLTPHRNTEKSELKLNSIKQKPNEDIETYARRIQEALDTLNRSFAEDEQNEVIKRENNRKARKAFENGLSDPNLRSKAISKGSVDLKEAIDYTIEQELRFSELKPINSVICTYCKKTNHTINQCRLRSANQKSQNFRPNQSSKKDITCYKCSRKGHFANECRLQGNKSNRPNENNDNSKDTPKNQNTSFSVREENVEKNEPTKPPEPISAGTSSLSQMIRIEEIKPKN